MTNVDIRISINNSDKYPGMLSAHISESYNTVSTAIIDEVNSDELAAFLSNGTALALRMAVIREQQESRELAEVDE